MDLMTPLPLSSQLKNAVQHGVRVPGRRWVKLTMEMRMDGSILLRTIMVWGLMNKGETS